MRRLILLSLSIVLAVAIALPVSGCGGDDEDDPASTTTSASGGGSTPPPAASGSGDPVISCMSSKGFTVTSPADIDTPAEQQALSECLPGVHGGGGVPPY